MAPEQASLSKLAHHTNGRTFELLSGTGLDIVTNQLLSATLTTRYRSHTSSTKPIGIIVLHVIPSLSGCGSQVVKVSVRGWHVTNLSPVPLKTHHVGERCSLNLSRAKTSSRWCGVVVKIGEANSDIVLVT
ncbi:hypothetical protein TNCV_1685961 [Trichonephila clavipes]|nr:hypothetical protein TNCV_1685961 [Trichonephila clavipes]